MANIVVARAYDSMYGNGEHAFSVVATDKSVEYVFGSSLDLFDGATRVKRLLASVGGVKPTDAYDWISLGTSNFGTYVFDIKKSDSSSIKDVISSEKESIEKSSGSSQLLSEADQKISNVVSEFAASEDQDSEEVLKKYISDIIDAAGTRDLNPWLDEWLEGKEIDDDAFDGIILERD